jgi:hypothetical protein
MQRPVAEGGAVLVPFLAVVAQGFQAAVAAQGIDQRLAEHAPDGIDAVIDILHPRHGGGRDAQAHQRVEPALAVGNLAIVDVVREIVFAESGLRPLAIMPSFREWYWNCRSSACRWSV